MSNVKTGKTITRNHRRNENVLSNQSCQDEKFEVRFLVSDSGANVEWDFS